MQETAREYDAFSNVNIQCTYFCAWYVYRVYDLYVICSLNRNNTNFRKLVKIKENVNSLNFKLYFAWG